MGQQDWKNRKRAESEAAPVDPIALTLALWLGVMVAVTGLIRLSEQAAAGARRMPDLEQTGALHPGPISLAPTGS